MLGSWNKNILCALLFWCSVQCTLFSRKNVQQQVVGTTKPELYQERKKERRKERKKERKQARKKIEEKG